MPVRPVSPQGTKPNPGRKPGSGTEAFFNNRRLRVEHSPSIRWQRVLRLRGPAPDHAFPGRRT